MKNKSLKLLADGGSLGTFEAPSSPFGFSVTNSADTGSAAGNMLEQILSTALGGVTIVAGVYFLFVFVIAAFKWLSAGGDSGKTEKARDSMLNALIGLVLIVASYAIIGVISTVTGIDILRPGKVLQNLAPTTSP